MYSAIKERATRSVKWSAFGQWVKRAVQLGILVLLARNLSAGEYGVIELATLILTLGQILQDFGLGRALVQTQADIEETCNVVFWANLLLSFVAYGLVAVSAPIVAQIFGESSLVQVLRVAGLQLVVLALRSVQMALVQRQFLYRSQFIAELCGSLALVISVGILLASGYRVWAYIYGVLISSTIQTFVLVVLIPWRPTLNFSFRSAESRSLLRFGAFAALETLQGWLLNYGDNLIVGYFLGIEALGMYALAFNIAVFSFSLVLQPLTSISYAAFSNLQSDIVEVRRAFLNILQISSVILIPMGVGIALLADPISHVILVDRWFGITPIIQLLALFPGSISHLLFINPEMYRSLGRPDVMPKLLLMALAYSLPAYIIGAQFGLMGFTLARVSVTAIFFPIQVHLASRFLKMGSSGYLQHLVLPTILTSLMALAAKYFISRMDMAGDWLGWVQIAAVILSSALFYFFMFWLVDREFLGKTLVLIRQIV